MNLLRKSTIIFLAWAVFSGAGAAEALKVKVDHLKVRANRQAFSFEAENQSIEGLQCTFDFILQAKSLNADGKITAQKNLDYQVELPLAYHSTATFFQDSARQDLGQKVFQIVIPKAIILLFVAFLQEHIMEKEVKDV